MCAQLTLEEGVVYQDEQRDSISPMMVSSSSPQTAISYFLSIREVKRGSLHVRNQIPFVVGLEGTRVRKPGMEIKLHAQVEAVSSSHTSDVSSSNLAHYSCFFADTFPQSLKKADILGENTFPD